MPRSYIIIDQSLFDVKMSNDLKRKNLTRDGRYLQDDIDTIVSVELINDNKDYYVLSWERGRPTSVLPRYSESGNNPKTNKIFTHTEIRGYLELNEVKII